MSVLGGCTHVCCEEQNCGKDEKRLRVESERNRKWSLLLNTINSFYLHKNISLILASNPPVSILRRQMLKVLVPNTSVYRAPQQSRGRSLKQYFEALKGKSDSGFLCTSLTCEESVIGSCLDHRTGMEQA